MKNNKKVVLAAVAKWCPAFSMLQRTSGTMRWCRPLSSNKISSLLCASEGMKNNEMVVVGGGPWWLLYRKVAADSSTPQRT